MDVSPADPLTRVHKAWRLRVLAVPSPTVPRFLLLLLALLTAGVEVGRYIFTLTAGGREWLAQAKHCGSPSWSRAEDSSWFSCMEEVQRHLAWFELGGVAVTMVAGLAVLGAVPTVLRRRRRLRPVGDRIPAASDRVSQLATEAGLRPAPLVMTGPSTVRDAFSYGFPGRYRIVLPPALAVRSGTSTFDAVVRHELAHLARHDVLLAWSARAVWYVLIPLLATPVVWALASGDTSSTSSYVPRAALLLVVGGAAAAAVLRAREFDADLSSASSAGQRAELVGVLEGVIPPPRRGWRRLTSLHPDARARVATIEHPGLLARAPILDALLSGFLAAVSIPLLDSLNFAVARSAYPNSPAIIIGTLMGATVGLSLSRLSLVERATGGPHTLRTATSRTALAVLTGYLLGGVASLADSEVHALTFPVGAVAMAGATFLTGGVAFLVADAAPRLTARGYTFASIAVSGAVFAIAVWAVESIVNDVSLDGWGDQARISINVLVHYGVHVWVTVVALSVLVLLRLRRVRAQAPSWLVEEGVAPLWEKSVRSTPRVREILLFGAAAGLVADVSILAFRLITGPSAPAEFEQRLITYAWVFGAAGAVTAVALLTVYGVEALAAALLASPVAAALAATGFVVGNEWAGGHLPVVDALEVVRAGIPLSVLLLIPLAALAFIPWSLRTSRRPALVAALVAALLSATVSGSALALHDTLSPLSSSDVSREEYVGDYAPWVNSEFHRIGQAIQRINSDQPSPTERARRIRAEVVVPFRYLRDNAAGLEIADKELREAHVDLVSSLKLNVAGYEDIAQAFRSRDQTLLAAGNEKLDKAGQRTQAWVEGLRAVARDQPSS